MDETTGREIVELLTALLKKLDDVDSNVSAVAYNTMGISDVEARLGHLESDVREILDYLRGS